MIDALALRILSDRDLGGEGLPIGSAYAVTYVHPALVEDSPVLDLVLEKIRKKVREYAGAELDDITVAQISPEEIEEAWKREVYALSSAGSAPRNLYAFVGYWVPA